MMMEYKDGLHLIPEHMHGAIARYVEHGIRQGQFLTAILSNDFMEAMGRADTENMAAIQGWAHFLYNYVPGNCYGSPQAVKEWMAHRGLAGPAPVETADAQT